MLSADAIGNTYQLPRASISQHAPPLPFAPYPLTLPQWIGNHPILVRHVITPMSYHLIERAAGWNYGVEKSKEPLFHLNEYLVTSCLFAKPHERVMSMECGYPAAPSSTSPFISTYPIFAHRYAWLSCVSAPIRKTNPHHSLSWLFGIWCRFRLARGVGDQMEELSPGYLQPCVVLGEL